MNNIESLRGLSSEQVARIVHAEQFYGDGGGYYESHIALVKAKGIELCESLGCSDIIGVSQLCDLHDAPEDTWLKGTQIGELFDEELGDDCESLNIYKLDGSMKTKDEYYGEISKKLRRKIAKGADRYVNIIKIADTDDPEKALWWYNKYSTDHEYYVKYDIIPDILQEALEGAKKNLIAKGRM